MSSTEPDCIRVLFTIGRLNVGGAERRLFQLLKLLHDTNIPVEANFFVVSGLRGVLDADFSFIGAKIFYGRPGIRGLFDFSRIILNIKPDIVHSNSESAAAFYNAIARISGARKTVAHIRSCGPPDAKRFTKYRLVYEPLTSIFSSVVLGVSNATRMNRSFLGYNWQVIHNGIDEAEVLSASSSVPPDFFSKSGANFIVLSRLDRIKNIPLAINFFHRYCSKYPKSPAFLHVVGPEGDCALSELKDLVVNLKLTENIFFHGPTSNPLKYLSHASCTLMCSDYEGLPGVVLESLACGTPVISTAIAPSVEISNLTAGIFIAAANDADEWVKLMHSALSVDRRAISSQFWSDSPFALNVHARKIMKIWSDLSGKLINGNE